MTKINNFYSNDQIDAILSSPPKGNVKGVSTLDLNLNQMHQMPVQKKQPIEKKERKSPQERKKKKEGTEFESLEWLDKKSSIITAQA